MKTASSKQLVAWLVLFIGGPILIFCALGIMVLSQQHRPARTPARIESASEADMKKAAAPPRSDAGSGSAYGIATDACQYLEKNGALRVDKDARKAWINPLIWFQMNGQQKEEATHAIAIYVSPDNPMVTLYDDRSARELASYGPFQGFKVH